MSVTAEVFHEDRLPSNAPVVSNMPLMLFTRDRSGASAALYSMFAAQRNESSIELQDAFPHWTSAVSFAALVVLPALNLWKSPDIETLYEPASAYSWTALPVWPYVNDPSPQFTSYAPACPSTLISMASSAAVVFHVVTKSVGAIGMPDSPRGRSAAAFMALPATSLTAPASTSSWRGGVSAFTPLLAALLRVNCIEEVPLLVMVPLDIVTPPVAWPDSRT